MIANVGLGAYKLPARNLRPPYPSRYELSDGIISSDCGALKINANCWYPPGRLRFQRSVRFGSALSRGTIPIFVFYTPKNLISRARIG
jgi:hypothetical protein